MLAVRATQYPLRLGAWLRVESHTAPARPAEPQLWRAIHPFNSGLGLILRRWAGAFRSIGRV